MTDEQWISYGNVTEHDACGIGAVVDILGRKSRRTVDDALRIVEKLEHRAGKDALGETGDGVGILLQISHDFFYLIQHIILTLPELPVSVFLQICLINRQSLLYHAVSRAGVDDTVEL